MPNAEVICQSSSPQINATTLRIGKERGGQELSNPLDLGSQALPHIDTHPGFCETSHGTLILPQGDRK